MGIGFDKVNPGAGPFGIFPEKLRTMLSRIATASFLIMLTLSSHLSSAQSFEKGNVILNGGIKISVYGINNTNEDDDEEDDGDAAASYTIPLGVEYALTNRIGVGAEIGICNYFTEEDSITRAIAEASSFDFLIKGNFHWVRGGRVDLSSGIGLGLSSFRYNSNDNLDSEFKSNGFYFRLSLVDFRVYLFKGVGLNAFVGIPYMNFENGRITDNLGSDFSYPLTFAGVDLGTGLVVKF